MSQWVRDFQTPDFQTPMLPGKKARPFRERIPRQPSFGNFTVVKGFRPQCSGTQTSSGGGCLPSLGVCQALGVVDEKQVARQGESCQHSFARRIQLASVVDRAPPQRFVQTGRRLRTGHAAI